MISDPSTAESQLGEGGSDRPAGEGSGTGTPSPAGRTCNVTGCTRTVCARGLCRRHYDSIRTQRSQESRRRKPTPLPPIVAACPDDLIPLVTQLVECDARPIFTLLWRAIGNWHLQGLLEEEAFMTSQYWPVPKPAAEPERPATAALCDLCAGTGWASYPDPFFGGALIDARCPACCDTTVRARKSRWEDNQGRKVGPR